MSDPKKFLFVTLGSLGDLHPCLGIAKELQSRGHHVTIATAPYHGEYVEKAGFTFKPIRPDLRPEEPGLVQALLDPRRGAEVLHRKYIFPHIRDTFNDLTPLAREADLMITSILAYAAPVVSKVSGTPWVAGILSPLAMWSGHEPPILAPLPWLGKLSFLPPSWHRAIVKLLFRLSLPWAKPLNLLRAENGLPTQNPFMEAHCSPELMLCLWSDPFGAPQPDWPKQARTTGFVFYDPKESEALSPELETFLSQGEPPVLYTLGSTVIEDGERFFSKFQNAAKLTGKRAIITVGKKGIEKFRSQSNQEVFYADYVPYTQLFPRVSLIVHQGGVGTTGQALRSGRPMIILSESMDQLDNAYRITQRRLGAEIRKHKLTAPHLASTIMSLLADTTVLENCRKVQSCVEKENGAFHAANLLEARLQKKG